MDQYTLYCTEEQTKNALELGAPIDFFEENDENNEHAIHVGQGLYAIIPTAEQMINWLEERGVFISIVHDTDENTYANYVETKEFSLSNVVCSSRQEAILVAIDKALEYLSNNKTK